MLEKLPSSLVEEIKKRFEERVVRADGCWSWKGKPTVHGYGQMGFKRNGQSVVLKSHRVSYEIHIGPIPDGLFVCHHCDNRICSNPEHLFLGAWIENNQDMISKNRHSKGDTSGTSKLTESNVLEIRARYKEGSLTHPQLATEYGVSEAAIGKAITGDTFAFLPGAQEKRTVTTLKEEDIRQIRSLYQSGRRQSEIAAQYGISRAATNLIVHRKRYKNVA